MCVCIELNKERILQLQTLRGGGGREMGERRCEKQPFKLRETKQLINLASFPGFPAH